MVLYMNNTLRFDAMEFLVMALTILCAFWVVNDCKWSRLKDLGCWMMVNYSDMKVSNLGHSLSFQVTHLGRQLKMSEVSDNIG